MHVWSTNPNSLTRLRGFLAVGPVGAISVGESSPPPLETWIKDDLGRNWSRFCCLTWNDHLPLDSLKGPEHPIGSISGLPDGWGVTREVCERKAFCYPHTFGRAAEMVTSMSLDPVNCLELGLAKFKFFLHIKYWDERPRRPCGTWKISLSPSHVPAAAYRGNMCAKIEKLDLSFSRNLTKYREHGDTI